MRRYWRGDSQGRCLDHGARTLRRLDRDAEDFDGKVLESLDGDGRNGAERVQRTSERRGARARAGGCRRRFPNGFAAIADKPRADGDVASGEIAARTELHHGPLDRRIARRLRVDARSETDTAIVQDGVHCDCVCCCHGPISFSLCIADFMHAMRLGPRHAFPPRRWTFRSRVSARAARLRTDPVGNHESNAARGAIRRPNGFRRVHRCLGGVWSSFGHIPHFGQPVPVPLQSVRSMFAQTDSVRKGVGRRPLDFAKTGWARRFVSTAGTVSCVDAAVWVNRRPACGSSRL